MRIRHEITARRQAHGLGGDASAPVIGPEPTPGDAEMAVRMLDGSPDGLLLVDSDARIVVANRSAETIFGFDDVGLVGCSVDDLVPDEQRALHIGHRRGYSSAPQKRLMGTDLQLFAQHRAGDVFPVEISLNPIVIDGEQQTIVTVRDVTEREEARASLLLHADRERSAYDLHDLIVQRLFAAGLSLQSVTNLIESPVARDRVIAVTDELDETVRAVRAAIFSIGTASDDQSLASQLASLVDERSGQLGFTPDLRIVGSVDDIPDFIGDQLVSAMTEAVSNVAGHAGATAATIRVTRTESTIGVVVRDNGRGIAATPKLLGGLSDLIWRAAELGGTCSVSSVEPTGTELVWQVPL